VRLLSPYGLNPAVINPLKDILANCIDFGRLAQAPIKLFVTATNIRTGRGHVFRNADITPDVLLASACLPTMFQAIEIDGESYWDGGYSGNPTITPLVRECSSTDTILVAINPVEWAEMRIHLVRSDPSAWRNSQAPPARRAPHRARYPQPPQRGFFQCRATQRAAHDRATAPSGDAGKRRGRRSGSSSPCCAILAAPPAKISSRSTAKISAAGRA
jgi:predicted acylesterase/phospholipase RssA